MKTFTLKRVASNEHGVFGVLIDGDAPFALTCEDSWRENQPDISCIPPGMYCCMKVDSPKFGNTFRVTMVEGRSHILFHKGNTEDDTHGCILVGEQFGSLHGKTAILHSGDGFLEFMERLEGEDSFSLHIMGC